MDDIKDDPRDPDDIDFRRTSHEAGRRLRDELHVDRRQLRAWKNDYECSECGAPLSFPGRCRDCHSYRTSARDIGVPGQSRGLTDQDLEGDPE